jgi:hypothetical protein
VTALHEHIVFTALITVLAGLLLYRGVNAPPSRRQRFVLIGGVVIAIGAVALAVLTGLGTHSSG